jgi:hypothetical protein
MAEQAEILHLKKKRDWKSFLKRKVPASWLWIILLVSLVAGIFAVNLQSWMTAIYAYEDRSHRPTDVDRQLDEMGKVLERLKRIYSKDSP